MTTVDRIFQLISENKLTAKEFANKVGVSQGNITDWKTGRAKPSVESLQKIAKYTNVQLDWLTGDSEYKTKADFLRAYNKDLYDFDVNTALSAELLHSIVDINSNYVDFIDDIKDFLISKKNVFAIKDTDIDTFLEKYPKNQKSQVKKSLTKIISALKNAQDNRNAYATIVSSIYDDKFQYYMCPVYRSNKCRTTKLGRREYRRKNTNRHKLNGYSKSRGTLFFTCKWRKHE